MIATSPPWQQTGLNMMLFLVGLQGLPPEPIEAAKIEGCTGWNLVRRIILPMLMPYVVITTLLAIVNGFKVFDLIWVMTQGGPGRPSETLAVPRMHRRGLHPVQTGLQRRHRRRHLGRRARLSFLSPLRPRTGGPPMSTEVGAGHTGVPAPARRASRSALILTRVLGGADRATRREAPSRRRSSSSSTSTLALPQSLHLFDNIARAWAAWAWRPASSTSAIYGVVAR